MTYSHLDISTLGPWVWEAVEMIFNPRLFRR